MKIKEIIIIVLSYLEIGLNTIITFLVTLFELICLTLYLLNMEGVLHSGSLMNSLYQSFLGGLYLLCFIITPLFYIKGDFTKYQDILKQRFIQGTSTFLVLYLFYYGLEIFVSFIK